MCWIWGRSVIKDLELVVVAGLRYPGLKCGRLRANMMWGCACLERFGTFRFGDLSGFGFACVCQGLSGTCQDMSGFVFVAEPFRKDLVGRGDMIRIGRFEM